MSDTADMPESNATQTGTALRNEIASVLNRHSAENGSDTPDFILADFLTGCLAMWDAGVRRREGWYGRAVAGRQYVAADPDGIDTLKHQSCKWCGKRR